MSIKELILLGLLALIAGRRTLAATLAVVAVYGIIQSVTIASTPPNSTDLRVVRDWAALWLFDRRSPFDLATPANYPPHALVLFSPLALISDRYVAIAWASLNAMLAPLVAITAYRLGNPEERCESLIIPASLFLLWAGLLIGIKTGQFTLVALGAALAAVAFADTKRLLAGLCMALALTKPHIGGAFVIWSIVTGRWIIPSSAGVAIVILTVIFALAIGHTPISELEAYGRSLWNYSGPIFHSGDIELRPLLHALVSNAPIAEMLNVLVIAILLTFTIILSRAEPEDRNRDLEIVSLCCALSLLSVFHNAYDMVLLLPASVLLLGGSRRDQLMAIVLDGAAILQPRTIWWRVDQQFGLHPSALALAMGRHADRAFALAVFCYLVWRSYSGLRTRSPDPRTASNIREGLAEARL